MKITKIEKKKRLYLIEVDDVDRFYVTEDTVVRYMLTKGMRLNQELLTDIKDFAQFSHGHNLALYYLSFKSRTIKEVRDYLRQHEIVEERIDPILKRLIKDKWLDDERYAYQVYEQNRLSGDKGNQVLKQKLSQKGISPIILNRVSETFIFDDVADKVAQKVYRKYQAKLSHRALEAKIVQGLVAKGFSYQEAQSAFSRLSPEKNEGEECDLLYKELEKQYLKYNRKYKGYDLRQRLIQALARKGFDFDNINQALRDFL